MLVFKCSNFSFLAQFSCCEILCDSISRTWMSSDYHAWLWAGILRWVGPFLKLFIAKAQKIDLKFNEKQSKKTNIQIQCLLQELLRLWIRLQYQADGDQDRFISSLWAVAKVSHSTKQLLFIIDAVREQVSICSYWERKRKQCLHTPAIHLRHAWTHTFSVKLCFELTWVKRKWRKSMDSVHDSGKQSPHPSLARKKKKRLDGKWSLSVTLTDTNLWEEEKKKKKKERKLSVTMTGKNMWEGEGKPPRRDLFIHCTVICRCRFSDL